jgi:hypothetical protein
LLQRSLCDENRPSSKSLFYPIILLIYNLHSNERTRIWHLRQKGCYKYSDWKTKIITSRYKKVKHQLVAFNCEETG